MTLTRRQMLALSGASLASAGLVSPALSFAADPLQRLEGRAFATDWAITLPSGQDIEALRPAIEMRLAEIDRMMSPWRLDSEVTGFNLAKAGSCPVSSETALVAAAALETAEASAGWFDPTVGPLLARWGFGPIKGDAAEVSHWQMLGTEPELLIKAEDGLTLDLCGIAKGWAMDRMAGIVAAAGHENFLIDIGGELLGRGLHPEGRAWQVAIEDPRPGAAGMAAALQLDGRAVATSGYSLQSFRLGDTTYSHIVDPHHMSPVAGQIASVSVLADTGMHADAWATALLAAGAEGPDLARKTGLATLFLIPGPDGLQQIATGGFDRAIL
ncbi:MAG: FAD:protein FMN transferase [Maritimibacter sp.]